MAKMISGVDKVARVGRLEPSADEVAILISSMAQTTNDANLRATKCLQQTQDLRADRNTILKERDNATALAALRKERILKLDATNSELQKKYDELAEKQEMIEAHRDRVMEGMTNTMEEWVSSTNEIRDQNKELLLRLKTVGEQLRRDQPEQEGQSQSTTLPELVTQLNQRVKELENAQKGLSPSHQHG